MCHVKWYTSRRRDLFFLPNMGTKNQSPFVRSHHFRDERTAEIILLCPSSLPHLRFVLLSCPPPTLAAICSGRGHPLSRETVLARTSVRFAVASNRRQGSCPIAYGGVILSSQPSQDPSPISLGRWRGRSKCEVRLLHTASIRPETTHTQCHRLRRKTQSYIIYISNGRQIELWRGP
jgi:hypothetical protein